MGDSADDKDDQPVLKKSPTKKVVANPKEIFLVQSAFYSQGVGCRWGLDMSDAAFVEEEMACKYAIDQIRKVLSSNGYGKAMTDEMGKDYFHDVVSSLDNKNKSWREMYDFLFEKVSKCANFFGGDESCDGYWCKVNRVVVTDDDKNQPPPPPSQRDKRRWLQLLGGESTVEDEGSEKKKQKTAGEEPEKNLETVGDDAAEEKGYTVYAVEYHWHDRSNRDSCPSEPATFSTMELACRKAVEQCWSEVENLGEKICEEYGDDFFQFEMDKVQTWEDLSDFCISKVQDIREGYNDIFSENRECGPQIYVHTFKVSSEVTEPPTDEDRAVWVKDFR